MWTANEALVACRQLGYAGGGKETNNLFAEYSVLCEMTTGAVAVDASTFGLADGPIVGSDVFCNGSENRIVDCLFDRNHICDHPDDLAVRCMVTSTGWLIFYINAKYCVLSMLSLRMPIWSHPTCWKWGIIQSRKSGGL
jgi:hypothetical protein